MSVIYEKPLVGTPWDYSNKSNWMYFNHHGLFERKVDTFFLYPTSVSPEVKTEVCEDIKYMQHNAHVSYLQAADTLASFTNIYAPYYRQLSAVGIVNNCTADKFMEAIRSNVTRTDVFAALDYYFENCNKGKPFILCGHSQGSFNCKIVLAEYMKAHPEYYKRMVACYAIGCYFPDSWFAENPHVKKATGETDTGVLITWNTEGPNGSQFNLPIGDGNGAFVINPLNWKTDETPADISLNKGSVLVDSEALAKAYGIVGSFKRRPKLVHNITKEIVKENVAGAADATINLKRGVLVTTTYDNFIPANPVFGDVSCHFEDWALFTKNIRENAKKRIKAFKSKS